MKSGEKMKAKVADEQEAAEQVIADIEGIDQIPSSELLTEIQKNRDELVFAAEQLKVANTNLLRLQNRHKMLCGRFTSLFADPTAGQ